MGSRKADNRALAAWLREHDLPVRGEVWAAAKAGERDIETLAGIAAGAAPSVSPLGGSTGPVSGELPPEKSFEERLLEADRQLRAERAAAALPSTEPSTSSEGGQAGSDEKRKPGSVAWVVVVAFVWLIVVKPWEPDPLEIEAGDLIGLSVDEAEAFLVEEGDDDLGLVLEPLDYSPAGRIPKGAWEVVATDWEVDEFDEGESVHVWAMYGQEVAWYKAHPTMPKVSEGSAKSPSEWRGKKFGAVGDLIETVWKPGKQRPKGDTHQWIEDLETEQVDWPYSDRLALDERERLGSLYVAGGRVLAVGQVPKAGAELRPGQLMVVYVVEKPKPKPKPTSDAPIEIPDVPDVPDYNDDDDFNVPGWLCPTRFC